MAIGAVFDLRETYRRDCAEDSPRVRLGRRVERERERERDADRRAWGESCDGAADAASASASASRARPKHMAKGFFMARRRVWGEGGGRRCADHGGAKWQARFAGMLNVNGGSIAWGAWLGMTE